MHVFIKSANPWLDKTIQSRIRKHAPGSIFYDNFDDFPKDAEEVVQICDGRHLKPHFNVMNTANIGLLNSYPSSDGLSRKDHLARVVEYWTAKRPDSILKRHVPQTIRLNLDYAEYVDEALAAADDLTLLSSLEENEAKFPVDRDWWILKPALIDCGAGIRIFSTMEELADCLEEADNGDEDESDAEDSGDDSLQARTPDEDEPGFTFSSSISGLDSLDGLITVDGKVTMNRMRNGTQNWLFDETCRIPSSQMREFVAQKYVISVPPLEGRKWHVRAYVLSLGRLKVYVYKELLALLATDPYQPPWKYPGLKSSLTNTALQSAKDVDTMESMRDFWKLPDDLLPGDWKREVFEQICDISGELIKAAVHTVADKFTPLNGCFELFAVDFLVDSKGNTWLLEFNETPAFYEHGVAGPLSEGLMESVMCVAMEHIRKDGQCPEDDTARGRLLEVLNETDHLAKSNITWIAPEI